MKSKKEIRKNIIDIRDKINSTEKKILDSEIINNFINSYEYKEAKVIFSYIGFGSEINTKIIINDALKKGKIVCVPKVKGKEMLIIKISSLDNLVKSNYGILEPVGNETNINIIDLDLIIMPGVAFDKFKNRIGYGGGYYDKLLYNSNISAYKIALAYDFQVLESIYSENHDIKVDKIITEKRVIK
ncbi:5-formyltetrahydrofolate cyclo-ligase [Clostridium sp. Ade.TY]|uniref:5-formyltetrahydrofolate cyclo-ligase n=1 Tax=Clostridium sp. Ade.TY TaxID=1391647 RepID=UPI0004257521|nr:5-formyltetrahydrofolate cyclo-ligase [Clostridium sp. Ade.TY]